MEVKQITADDASIALYEKAKSCTICKKKQKELYELWQIVHQELNVLEDYRCLDVIGVDVKFLINQIMSKGVWYWNNGELMFCATPVVAYIEEVEEWRIYFTSRNFISDAKIVAYTLLKYYGKAYALTKEELQDREDSEDGDDIEDDYE